MLFLMNGYLSAKAGCVVSYEWVAICKKQAVWFLMNESTYLLKTGHVAYYEWVPIC